MKISSAQTAAVFACFLGAASAHAQHPLVMQRLSALNRAAPAPSQQTLSDEVAKTADTLYAARNGCARSGLAIEQVLPATAERYVFNNAIKGQVRNGWTVTVRHPACDPAPVRYMVVQDSAGALRTTRVNRGVSYAHDSLIGDTLPLAVLAAELFLKRSNIPCNEPTKAQLGVMRIDSATPDLGQDVLGVRYKGTWTEVWPLTMCGQTIEVPVAFTADGDGGAYNNIKGASIRLLAAEKN